MGGYRRTPPISQLVVNKVRQDICGGHDPAQNFFIEDCDETSNARKGKLPLNRGHRRPVREDIKIPIDSLDIVDLPLGFVHQAWQLVNYKDWRRPVCPAMKVFNENLFSEDYDKNFHREICDKNHFSGEYSNSFTIEYLTI